jgi:BASS family bile acid:Na+ symporter
MICLFDQLANAFPLCVLAACVLELVEPGLFTWFRGNAIVIGLAVIMLGMGLGLTFDDFLRVTTRPTTVAVGFMA